MKKRYYGVATNDSGASMDICHESSIAAVAEEARRTLASGWTIHIMRVDIDGDGHSVMGNTEVKTFTIR